MEDGSGTSALADGIYEGAGSGFRGTTRVAVTVEGGEIADITITSFEDDAPYFTRARNAVVSAIISSQSLDVDTVSGATYSSSSILEAVADALDLEYTAPVQSGHGQGGRGSANAGGHRRSRSR